MILWVIDACVSLNSGICQGYTLGISIGKSSQLKPPMDAANAVWKEPKANDS